MDVDVDSDEVHERARAHRPAGAVRHRLVEILGAHPGLVQHAHAVVEERDEDAVDDEAWRVVAANGLLAGALETASEGRISDDSTQQRIEAHRDQLEAYEGLCRELGAKPVEVAVAWLLRNPVVSTTIIGATTIEELQSDLGALSVQLDAEVAERLDQIWPGPGEAPQAYAW